MPIFEPNKTQQRLIAAYLAGEDVADSLLVECKHHPELLKYISTLVANDRLLCGELDSVYSSQLFCSEVVENIKSRSSPSLANVIRQKLLEREAANNWVNKPWLMAASIVMLISSIFIGHLFETNRSFATITKIAAYSSAQNTLSVGSELGVGEVNLTHGFSELMLENGVVLVLEAPVNLTLNSPEKVTINHGKLVARVPENAIGFRIDTPSSEIVDLGTEFGVDVTQSGDSQVHVLDGEVKARADKSQSYQHIKKDQALSFSLEDKIEEIASNPKEFMRVLPGHSAHNPNYLHWSFDAQHNKQFSSINSGVSKEAYPAQDESTSQPIQQINGVFDKAIEFDGNGNWLSTDFPGIASDNPRTVSFWVKVPRAFSTNNAYGIISWGLQQNFASWQISPNPEPSNGQLGRLRIGTYQAQVVGTTDLRDDEWHHVAVVLYGGETSNISTHVLLYVDGELEKTQHKSIAKVNTTLDHPKSKPLSFGRNIGFNPYAKHITQNYFKGAIDELYIFEAALNHDQIQTLMTENSVK